MRVNSHRPINTLDLKSGLSSEQQAFVDELRKTDPRAAANHETMIKLQNLQEAATAVSNMLKTLHEMRMSIINNMR